MSSIQDKLFSKLDPLKRKVFDNNLTYAGTSVEIIRLTVEEDEHYDETITILNHSKEIIQISNLANIPLSRLRKDLTKSYTASTTGLYLYDILPITIKAKFATQLNNRDIIIKAIYDDSDLSNPFYLVLQITEVLGSLGNSLISLEFNAAPYTKSLPIEVVDIINSYKEEKNNN